jgi:broad specificity phosphatase PhoE
VGYSSRDGRISVPKLLIVRHGFVDGITPERFRGRKDVPLSELGREQARLAAARIATSWNPAVVYTSPLQRCVQTGAAIVDACGAPLVTDSALIDLDYGDWQWLTLQEAAGRWPDEFGRWLETPHLVRFPNGESLQDLAARIATWLRGLFERHTTGTIVIVGHDSSNRVLLLRLLDLPLADYRCFSQDPCGLSEIEVSGQGVRILRVNDTHHLDSPTHR